MPFVEDICRRLDGIALAIELAAARVRTIPIQKLSEHLELRVLAGGRDRQPRQQTMHALIDWSYNLLTPQEQDFCGAAPPAWAGSRSKARSRSAARTTSARSISSRRSSTSLYSLRIGGSRSPYRLLEPIRQFAREKLEQIGETRGALERHAQVLCGHRPRRVRRVGYEPRPRLADAARKRTCKLPRRVELDDWRRERSGLGAAIAGNTAPIFMRLTLLSEGTQWCERVLGAGVSLPAELRRACDTRSRCCITIRAPPRCPRAGAGGGIALPASRRRSGVGSRTLAGCKPVRSRITSRRPNRLREGVWSARARSGTGGSSPMFSAAARSRSRGMASSVVRAMYARKRRALSDRSGSTKRRHEPSWWGHSKRRLATITER